MSNSKKMKFCFDDESGILILPDEKNISLFGKKDTLIYKLMENTEFPLKDQGGYHDIYQVSIKI